MLPALANTIDPRTLGASDACGFGVATTSTLDGAAVTFWSGGVLIPVPPSRLDPGRLPVNNPSVTNPTSSSQITESAGAMNVGPPTRARGSARRVTLARSDTGVGLLGTGRA